MSKKRDHNKAKKQKPAWDALLIQLQEYRPDRYRKFEDKAKQVSIMDDVGVNINNWPKPPPTPPPPHLQVKEVNVVDVLGMPLADTHPARARQLLQSKKAKILLLEPFTIQLIESSTEGRRSTMNDDNELVRGTPATPITDPKIIAEMPLAQVEVKDVYKRVVPAYENAGIDFAQEGSDKTVLTYYRYEDVYAEPQAPIVNERQPYVYKGFDRSSGDKRDYDNSIKGTWMTEGIGKVDSDVSPTSKPSIYDRHKLVRSQTVEVLYPKSEPNPVYVITTVFRGMQYEVVLTTTLMLGFFQDETYYQNGAWQGGRSEAWYGHHEAVITRTIPGLKKIEDQNDEHYGLYVENPQVTVRETTWGIMWYNSPTDAIAEILKFNPSHWLEDFHVV